MLVQMIDQQFPPARETSHRERLEIAFAVRDGFRSKAIRAARGIRTKEVFDCEARAQVIRSLLRGEV